MKRFNIMRVDIKIIMIIITINVKKIVMSRTKTSIFFILTV